MGSKQPKYKQTKRVMSIKEVKVARRHSNRVAFVDHVGNSEADKLANFKRSYGFRKSPSVKSPVSGWEQEHMENHVCGPYCMHHKTEIAMLKNKPHGYGHAHVGGRAGKLRLSNTPGAHRLGASRKK